MTRKGIRPLYVELDEADRARLDRIAARMAAKKKRPVRIIEAVRQLLRDADRAG